MNHDHPGLNKSNSFKKTCICDYKEIFHAFVNTTMDSVIIVDPEFKILDISCKGMEFFGFENSEEIIGRPISAIADSVEDKEKLYQSFMNLLSGSLKENGNEYVFSRKDGNKYYGQLSSSVIKDENNHPKYVISVIHDISKHKLEQKKQEAIYKISEAASSSRSLEELYTKVHNIIKGLTHAGNFYIAICDEQQSVVSFPYYIDEHDGPDAKIKYGPQKFGKGLTEYAIKSGEVLLCDRDKQLELLKEGNIDLIGEFAAEWLGVPLKTIDNKTIGLLAVQTYDNEFNYTRSDIDILSFVSTQVAMAIERMRKETDLLELKKAVEDSGDAIFITGPDGIFKYVNPEFTRLYGFAANEVVGKSTPRILKSGAHDKSSYEKLWHDLLNKKTVKGEIINKTRNGSLIYIEGTASSIVDEEGRITGFLSVQRGISERKESEKLKDALYKISEAANVTLDLSMLYEKIHEIVKELMPVRNFYIALYDPETELLSFPYFVDEFDPPQKPKKAGKGLTEYVLRTGMGMLVDEEKNLKLRRSGKIQVIGTPSKIWLGVPLKIFEKVTGVMVVQDYLNPDAFGEREKKILTFVSEQIASAIYKKSVEEELLEFTTELQNHRQLLENKTEELTQANSRLEKSEKELQELNSAKDKYFSIIAHDLKSPFNGLLGFSNMLLLDFDQFNKNDIKTYLKYINSSLKNIFNLVENLLDWSRVQTGRLEFNPERLNLYDYVNSTLKLLESNSLGKSIKTSVKIDENLLVLADRKMLQSVLQNLISNAIKFTKAGGEINISSSNETGFAYITVRDNGVGIQPDRIKDLFKIDKQTSTEGTAKEKGTGLGLILCKEFIEKCGGSITVSSQFGLGTDFKFSLPVLV
ncbi:MAG: PAS domain S-box protein [Bacteroidota bacterium]|nr:PAS domain S-box protein [Bacteroidota bacterium]